MITAHNILKMARHIVRRSDGYRDRRIMHPRRDWLLGLAGTAILFVAGAFGAGYLFWNKSIAATEAYEVALDTVTYDSKLIKRVLAEYRGRSGRYEVFRGAVPTATSTATSTKALGASATSAPVAE